MADASTHDGDGVGTVVQPGPSRWWLVAMPASLSFIAAALALEVVASRRANSDVPAWAHLVPLAWPLAARVVWWLTAAAAAGTFRVGLRKVGLRTNRVADVVTVAPFVVFAAGVAAGADWATWH